ncbi:MAG: hypothetical protein IPK85_20460 [Gemmatimonadetes bacterium]|nr:hypothetical protein [Gemmatimonadota bacterium]
MSLVIGLIVLGALAWLVQPSDAERPGSRRGLTLAQWYLAGLAVFLVVLAWTVAPRNWLAGLSPERVTRMERGAVLARRFRAVIDARDAAQSEISVRDAQRRLRGGERAFVLVDTGVATAAATFIDSLVRLEARRLEISEIGVQVFIAGSRSDTTQASALRVRRPIDMTWLLPDSLRSRCLAVVRVNRAQVAELQLASVTSLLGPCAFVGRFGRPGAAVRRWLEAMEYSTAANASWVNAAVQSDPMRERRLPRWDLTATQSRCILGHRDGCRAILALDSSTTRGVDPEYSPLNVRDFSTAGPRLGRYERLFLSDMVRALGPERFGEFWRSGRAADSAFATAAGHTLEEATSRWMRQFYDDTPGGPARPAPTGIALGAVLGLALLTSYRGARRLLRDTTRR